MSMTWVSSRATFPGMEKSQQDPCCVSSVGGSDIWRSHVSRIGISIRVSSQSQKRV